MIHDHMIFMMMQMVNSTVAETRVYWRRMAGLPDHIVNDPRSLHDALNDAATALQEAGVA